MPEERLLLHTQVGEVGQLQDGIDGFELLGTGGQVFRGAFVEVTRQDVVLLGDHVGALQEQGRVAHDQRVVELGYAREEFKVFSLLGT